MDSGMLTHLVVIPESKEPTLDLKPQPGNI
jgi:hypothetical protein